MTEEARKCTEALRYIERTLIRTGGIAEDNMAKDVARAIDLIESLSAQLEQVTKERDAAVEELNKLKRCEHCVGYEEFLKIDGDIERCNECDEHSLWQWRGVKKEVEG